MHREVPRMRFIKSWSYFFCNSLYCLYVYIKCIHYTFAIFTKLKFILLELFQWHPSDLRLCLALWNQSWCFDKSGALGDILAETTRGYQKATGKKSWERASLRGWEADGQFWGDTGAVGTGQCCLNTVTKVMFISVFAIQVWEKGWDLWTPA